ncbi:PspC domain-containing protein [Streptacidiphilus sp. N1-12]|uniref:PspC domain-containing protein n=2 Tax=Streptacidiphilus alkalitolerans TaxID=3342712 RepID=A0ABV6V5R3_9ACTN
MTEDAPPTQPVPEPGNRPRSARPPLERSRDRRVVAGVCGGLGRHLDIDPVVFRVVIAVLCLSGGVGLFIYGLAWLVVPVERTRRNELQRLLSGRVDGQSLGAVLVTVLGTGIFFSYMGSAGHIFPLLLIALLAFAALRYDPAKHPRRRLQQPLPGDPPGEDGEPTGSSGFEGTIFGVTFRTTPPSAPPEQPTVPVPPGAPAWWKRTDPLAKDAPEDTVPLDTPPADAPPWAPEPPPAPPGPPAPPFAPLPPRERRSRSFLGSAFFFLALITGGSVWWLSARDHHSIDVLTVLASSLLVLGLGLVVCARWGRGRSLAVWATLLTLAIAAVGASPARLSTSYQHRVWTPTAAASVQPDYNLGTGQATLDLSRLAAAPGRTVTTDVHLGVGKLLVLLPPGSRVEITAHVGLGSIHLPGTDDDSGGVSANRSTELNPEGAARYGTINLDLSVGAGDLEVTQ